MRLKARFKWPKVSIGFSTTEHQKYNMIYKRTIFYFCKWAQQAVLLIITSTTVKANVKLTVVTRKTRARERLQESSPSTSSSASHTDAVNSSSALLSDHDISDDFLYLSVKTLWLKWNWLALHVLLNGGSKRFGCHASFPSVSRCCTRGKSEDHIRVADLQFFYKVIFQFVCQNIFTVIHSIFSNSH